MRRTSFVALILGLVALFATPAAAREIVNGSQNMVQMQGYWGSYDDTTGVYVDAGITATDYGSEVWLEYYRFSSTPITCDDGVTPGWLNESLWASGPATLETGKSYASGTAAGTVTGWMDSWIDCWYGEEAVPQNGVPGGDVSFDVVAHFASTSPLIREKSASSFKIPGETNSHNTYSSTYRYGDVHATVDGEMFSGFGQFGKVSWRYHSNSNNP